MKDTQAQRKALIDALQKVVLFPADTSLSHFLTAMVIDLNDFSHQHLSYGAKPTAQQLQSIKCAEAIAKHAPTIRQYKSVYLPYFEQAAELSRMAQQAQLPFARPALNDDGAKQWRLNAASALANVLIEFNAHLKVGDGNKLYMVQNSPDDDGTRLYAYIADMGGTEQTVNAEQIAQLQRELSGVGENKGG